MSYFHTAKSGPSVDGFREVFVAAAAYAVKHGIKHVVLAVHAKTNLYGVVSDAIGEITVKSLGKGSVNLVSGVALHLTTERIGIPTHDKYVLIAAHTSTKYLEKLESDPMCSAIFFAPWHDQELSEFIKRHGSVELGANA